MRSTRRRSSVSLVLLLQTITIVFASGACGSGAKDAASSDTNALAKTAVAVRTAPVVLQPFSEKLGAIGTVVVRAGHVALLSAPAPTRVAQVFVSNGQHVSAGATLVVLEQAAFREAARSAEASLSAAQRNYDRARTLSQAGILPRKDLEQATADLAKA